MEISDGAATGCVFIGDTHWVLPRREGVEVSALYLCLKAREKPIIPDRERAVWTEISCVRSLRLTVEIYVSRSKLVNLRRIWLIRAFFGRGSPMYLRYKLIPSAPARADHPPPSR